MPVGTLIPEMRPISDLRTCLPEIEAAAKESAEPIVLTRNGKPALVMFDSDVYNERIQRERHIAKLREAEIEEKYRSETFSLDESRKRLEEIARITKAIHA